MNLLHALGYLGASLTGLVLGLLGGGGALLTIPVLVYMFNIEASLATSYSLLLVGITASSGAYQNIRKKLIDYNAALYYGVPSVITVFIVRRWVMPNLPKIILSINGYSVDKNLFILLLLTAVMLLSAYKMITSVPEDEDEKPHHIDHLKLGVVAILVGGFLGLVGAGGGFLMVPSLIYFANTSTKKAIGTSLLLISLNALIGFLGDMGSHVQIDWQFLFTFLAFSVGGVFVGHYMANIIHSHQLKKYFGWFLLLVAVITIVKAIGGK